MKSQAKKASKTRNKASPSPPKASHPGPVRCSGINKKGQPCQMAARKGSAFCLSHDPSPEAAEARKKRNVAGGVARSIKPGWVSQSIKSREDLRIVVDRVIDRVAKKDMDVRIGYALVPHLALMEKLLPPAAPLAQEKTVDPLPYLVETLDAHPEAKAEMIKRVELLSS